MNTEPLQRSEHFSVGDTARLKLSNVRGLVDLRAGDPGVITVTAVKHADGNLEHTVVDLRQSADGTVHVETRFPDGQGGWLALLGIRQPCRVDYTVRLPSACAVELSVVASDTFVQGLAGDFNLHTVSGSLRLADLTGSLRLHTVSGDVLGERLTATGPVQLSTVSGRITLLESDLPAASGNTVSGDLNLATRLREGPYVFNSVSGDIRLSVPFGTRCAVSLHSQNGRIHSNVTTHGLRDGEGLGPTLRLHSVSGDLWLVASEEATPSPTTGVDRASTPPTPPTPPAPDRRAVLERISRGELSVEEAMAALRVQ
jgi:hypothetical protein